MGPEESIDLSGTMVYVDGKELGSVIDISITKDDISNLKNDMDASFLMMNSYSGEMSFEFSKPVKDKVKVILNKLNTYERLYNIWNRTKKNRTKQKLFKRLFTLNMEITGIIYSDSVKYTMKK